MKTPWIVLLCLTVSLLAGENGTSPDLIWRKPIVHQLAQFIEWPASRPLTGPLIIGIVGNDSPAMATEVEERPVEFRHVFSPEQMRRCHVVYFAEPVTARIEQFLESLRGEPVLTVAAVPGFARQGGMVELTRHRLGQHLTINSAATRKAGLRIHPGLWSVANFLSKE